MSEHIHRPVDDRYPEKSATFREWRASLEYEALSVAGQWMLIHWDQCALPRAGVLETLRATLAKHPCPRCGEPIALEDWIEPVLGLGEGRRLYHLECFMRGVVGSIGHQQGLCMCHGGPGTLDDPPELTNRQAARAAIDHYLRTHGYPPFDEWAAMRLDQSGRDPW